MYRQSEKNLLSSNISSTCPRNMVNFGPLAAEIVSLVWGTPANSNGFGVLAALLHGILVVGVSQTLRRWTEGATYIRQGGHHVGHWPTFLVIFRLGILETFLHYCFAKRYHCFCLSCWEMSDACLPGWRCICIVLCNHFSDILQVFLVIELALRPVFPILSVPFHF